MRYARTISSQRRICECKSGGGSLRAGARYNNYYNDPYSQNEPSPYVNASLKYNYMAASYAELGVSYDRSSTDLFSDKRWTQNSNA